MAAKKTNEVRTRRIANISSMVMVLLLSALFIYETFESGMNINYGFAGFLMLLGFVFVVIIIRSTIYHYKLGFNVPALILLFYTSLMALSNWHSGHFLLVSVSLVAISCLYSSFQRSLIYILFQNALIGFFILRGTPIGGPATPMSVFYVNWVVYIFISLIMLAITKIATIELNKALENEHSFRDLMATTENYVAMIDSKNEIVYASKTLSQMSDVEDPELVQGRPIIDLFPGRTLKIHAGKMLREKDDYAEDWEFTLDGQKRYFKAVSHSLPGGSEGTLISLYDMTHLAERDEIAVMKDSMKIGLFFMNSSWIVQDHYSRYLEEMLEDTKLFGKNFMDIIGDSITPSELEAVKDYLNMVLERAYDQDMLEEINPLSELHFIIKRNNTRKVFQFAFTVVERARGELFVLVTVYDITTRVELQQRLAEEEARRQEEMQSFFELIQVQPDVFNDFMADMEHEFDTIDKVLKDDNLTAHEALVKTYQSVHAMKSNAVILGLNIFGEKVHNLESKIKKLREVEGEASFSEMLNLTVDIEKLSNEKESFKEIIARFNTYTNKEGKNEDGKMQNIKIMIESLEKAASKAASDSGKQVDIIADDIDIDAVEKGPRRVMKDILTQLVRNAVVHGIEDPEVRKEKNKSENGAIKISIKMAEDGQNIQIRCMDDGAGLNYEKIGERALSKNLIKPEDVNNQNILMKVIFAPGFSTAATEDMHAGRGIGLNLVRDRIKEVNGSIKLRSETDKGVLFLVSLPCKQSS